MKKTVFIYASFALFLIAAAMVGFPQFCDIVGACYLFGVLNCFLIITCTGIVVGHIKKLIKVLTDPRYRIDRKD